MIRHDWALFSLKTIDGFSDSLDSQLTYTYTLLLVLLSFAWNLNLVHTHRQTHKCDTWTKFGSWQWQWKEDVHISVKSQVKVQVHSPLCGYKLSATPSLFCLFALTNIHTSTVSAIHPGISHWNSIAILALATLHLARSLCAVTVAKQPLPYQPPLYGLLFCCSPSLSSALMITGKRASISSNTTSNLHHIDSGRHCHRTSTVLLNPHPAPSPSSSLSTRRSVDNLEASLAATFSFPIAAAVICNCYLSEWEVQ